MHVCNVSLDHNECQTLVSFTLPALCAGKCVKNKKLSQYEILFYQLREIPITWKRVFMLKQGPACLHKRHITGSHVISSSTYISILHHHDLHPKLINLVNYINNLFAHGIRSSLLVLCWLHCIVGACQPWWERSPDMMTFPTHFGTLHHNLYFKIFDQEMFHHIFAL